MMDAAPQLDVRPVTLEGAYVRLEPLAPHHVDGIARAGSFDEIWTWIPEHPRTRDDFARWLDRTLAAQREGLELPFATIDRATGEVVGSTRFMAISPRDRRLEIGHTWLTPRAQHTPINTEAKFLQLRHCFETLACLRVELKTDARNLTSQRAIERIGAVREGVFRKHMRTQGGHQRDSVYYSITDDDWPAVQRRLEAMLRPPDRLQHPTSNIPHPFRLPHLASNTPARYPHPMPQRVTVRVPATSANLGPGFDSLGLALALTQDVTVMLGPQPETRDGLVRLALDAARSSYRLARIPVPDLCASGESVIPIGRGLGASAAARAAGIVAANELMGRPLSDDQMLALGAGLEGHADNMAPALFGGLRVVVRDGDGYRHVAAPLAPGLRVVLFVPDFEMPTGESRKLLPASLSKDDAVHNIGRAALLVAALACGEWGVLDVATQDRLHQPARARIFPAMPDIFAAAKSAGALCAYLSGGGSTIAAFTRGDEERIARAMREAGAARGYSGRTLVTSPAEAGAAVVASA